jgi:transcriptional regulator with XRE-family HTH domain
MMTELRPRTRLIRAREGLGLNRQEFAWRIGVSLSYVSHIEVGRKTPSAQLKRDWLKALGNGATEDWFEPEPRWPSTAAMLCLSNEG